MKDIQGIQMEQEQKIEASINIRAKSEQRNLIDRARRILGKNRSEFMLEASLHRAEDVLLEQSFFSLNKIQFDQFCDLLDNPPAPKDNLCRLLKKKSPWEM